MSIKMANNKKPKKKEMKGELSLPEGVSAEVSAEGITLKGKGGEVAKRLINPFITITVENNIIQLVGKRTTQREKKMIATFKAHLKNMIKGVTEGHFYTLKVCSGHFPMNVSVNNNELTIKNFIGEKVPRVLPLKEGVSVKVEGDLIKVEGPDKELTGQVSADIEELTKRSKYDTRIFQDGIYIINKDGKELK